MSILIITAIGAIAAFAVGYAAKSKEDYDRKIAAGIPAGEGWLNLTPLYVCCLFLACVNLVAGFVLFIILLILSLLQLLLRWIRKRKWAGK